MRGGFFAAIVCLLAALRSGPFVIRVVAALTAALAIAVPGLAWAQACAGLTEGEQGRVVEIIDGDTVVLDGGLEVRMVGTQAPKLPLGREGFATWPLADEAKSALEALTLGETVTLYYGGERRDRYDRALAHIVVNDGGVWAQRDMLAQGLARVYSFPDNRMCLGELFAAEAAARSGGLGIWTDPYYSLRRADRPGDLLGLEGQYELVEGLVLLADQAGQRVYLNFGTYWKEDFTAVIERESLDLFAENLIDPLDYQGATVRIRGWIDEADGPRITVTHPEQIEVLSAP